MQKKESRPLTEESKKYRFGQEKKRGKSAEMYLNPKVYMKRESGRKDEKFPIVPDDNYHPKCEIDVTPLGNDVATKKGKKKNYSRWPKRSFSWGRREFLILKRGKGNTIEKPHEAFRRKIKPLNC